MSVFLLNRLYCSQTISNLSRQAFLSFKLTIQRNSRQTRIYSTHEFPMDKMHKIKEDILLYTLEKTSFIKKVTIFGIGQLVICSFLGCNVFFSLKDTPQFQDSSDSKRLNLGEFRYRLFASMGCFAVGIIAAAISYFLPTRIIKHVTLCKGGKLVSILTYGPFGKVTKFKAPLKDLSCMISRKDATSYLPLKVKKRWFFYLIDAKGQFHQTSLFDITVGTKSWK